MRLKEKIGKGVLVVLLTLVGVGIGMVCMLGNHVTTVVAGEEDVAVTAEAGQAEYVPTEFRVINGIEYPVNENGLTYGAAGDSDGDGRDDTHPDLIAVRANNGKNGYVYWEDLESRTPEGLTLEEALATDWNRPFTVYAVDGVTIIGQFGDGEPAEGIVYGATVGDEIVSADIED